jgi:plastocyanin
MSESDSKQLEMIFIQFLKFLQESSNETYASKSVDEKIVDVYFGKTEKGDDVIKVTGKRDGKAVTKDRATLTFSVGELVCFKVQQDAKGKHRFCLTSSPLAGPTSSPLPGSPLPITSGKMLYQITSRTPKTFYYGCSDKEGMGGKIVIKN